MNKSAVKQAQQLWQVLLANERRPVVPVQVDSGRTVLHFMPRALDTMLNKPIRPTSARGISSDKPSGILAPPAPGGTATEGLTYAFAIRSYQLSATEMPLARAVSSLTPKQAHDLAAALKRGFNIPNALRIEVVDEEGVTKVAEVAARVLTTAQAKGLISGILTGTIPSAAPGAVNRAEVATTLQGLCEAYIALGRQTIRVEESKVYVVDYFSYGSPAADGADQEARSKDRRNFLRELLTGRSIGKVDIGDTPISGFTVPAQAKFAEEWAKIKAAEDNAAVQAILGSLSEEQKAEIESMFRAFVTAAKNDHVAALVQEEARRISESGRKGRVDVTYGDYLQTFKLKDILVILGHFGTYGIPVGKMDSAELTAWQAFSGEKRAYVSVTDPTKVKRVCFDAARYFTFVLTSFKVCRSARNETTLAPLYAKYKEAGVFIPFKSIDALLRGVFFSQNQVVLTKEVLDSGFTLEGDSQFMDFAAKDPKSEGQSEEGLKGEDSFNTREWMVKDYQSRLAEALQNLVNSEKDLRENEAERAMLRARIDAAKAKTPAKKGEPKSNAATIEHLRTQIALLESERDTIKAQAPIDSAKLSSVMAEISGLEARIFGLSVSSPMEQKFDASEDPEVKELLGKLREAGLARDAIEDRIAFHKRAVAEITEWLRAAEGKPEKVFGEEEPRKEKKSSTFSFPYCEEDISKYPTHAVPAALANYWKLMEMRRSNIRQGLPAGATPVRPSEKFNQLGFYKAVGLFAHCAYVLLCSSDSEDSMAIFQDSRSVKRLEENSIGNLPPIDCFGIALGMYSEANLFSPANSARSVAKALAGEKGYWKLAMSAVVTGEMLFPQFTNVRGQKSVVVRVRTCYMSRGWDAWAKLAGIEDDEYNATNTKKLILRSIEDAEGKNPRGESGKPIVHAVRQTIFNLNDATEAIALESFNDF